MNFFFIALFVIFFVIPAINKAGKKNKRSKRSRPRRKQSNWGKSNAQLRNYGHDGTRERTHRDLHDGDGDENVFPEDHIDRVRARDLRDKIKFAQMEKVIHGRKNRGITRAGNKGRDDWGVRANNGGSKGLIILLALAAIAYWVYSENILDRIIG